MKILIIISLALLAVNLHAQEYFSKRFDAGNTNFYNNIKTIIEENDTMYYIAFNVCDFTDSSFVECSVVGKIDKEGNILREVPFGWLDPNQRARPFSIDNNQLLVVDGIFENNEPLIRLLILDKHSLDSLFAYDYKLDKEVNFYEDTGVIAYDKYYVLMGWSHTGVENKHIDWCFWIDKQTMEVDTITTYPFDYVFGTYNFAFIDRNNYLTIYYDIYEPVDKGLGLPQSRGFIKYDTEQNIVFHYQDTLSKRELSIAVPTGLVQKNGNMVYKQDYQIESLDTFPLSTPPSDFEIVCINPKGNINWRFHQAGFSPFGRKEVYSLSETNEGDVLGCGLVKWFFNITTYFDFYNTYPPEPEPSGFYIAPYIFKLDGETGEMIWQYALIELGEYGYAAPNYLSELYELSDGSLFGGGGYKIRDENGRSKSFDSWVVRLPPNACLSNEIECTFESFLTDTEDLVLVDISEEKPVLVYPNPFKDILYLRPLINSFREVHLRVSNIAGQSVFNTQINLLNTQTIATNHFPSGVLVIEFYDAVGQLIQSNKIIKQ